ncbi:MULTISPECIES: HPr family phosphocarrier protein [unclassified Salinicola]|uniref:HPr family phosphocarrier protein n=1 Tax=unclassified Salinicola TaxID=2634022 RepID=UPI001A8DB26C|nr:MULTISPECIES: HPr family phosphocarrier protein [unclassified Salinicola]MCE3027529.1 HPr family phosphocarrier protein [Salinicola sp. DM10]WIX34228.1 HPr family phosphocarrier protein [Salinicola sp. JS01]
MPKRERELRLTNRRGLHARAATKLVQCCQPFTARVAVHHGDRIADAANIMSLLMLAAPCGTPLVIVTEGDDAEPAMEAITALFDARFHEDE